MLMPSKEWEPITEWAARNNWTRDDALKQALAHNCIEWGGSRFDDVVRFVPDAPTKGKWVKISKSDQP